MADQSTPVAGTPTPAAPLRRSARPVPQRDAEFDHLGLAGLRTYRRTLTHEESQVSYWRRILQARVDVLVAGQGGRALDSAALATMLTSDRVGVGRRALIEISPADDIPPLPNLAALWARQPDPADPAAVAEHVADLTEAEQELSSYRSAVHHRLGAATGELIARYRERPALCLSALPVPPLPQQRTGSPTVA